MNLVATDALSRAVLQNSEHFSSHFNFSLDRGPAPDDGSREHRLITHIDPPDHGVLRGFLRRWFAPAALRKREPIVRAIVEELVDSLPSHGTIDFAAAIAHVVPQRVVYSLIGIPRADWDQVQGWADEANGTLPVQNVEVIERIQAYLVELVRTRSRSGERDESVVDGFLHPRGGDPEFAPEHIPEHLRQLILAGTDTTSGLVANLFFRLLESRENWERLRRQPELAAAAIEESLRCDSPIQYTLRTVTEAADVGGCPVAPRDRIVVSLQSANWDEDTWGERSQEFDLDRPGAAGHIAFGSGIHACLGAPLARIEARVVLETMLHRFPDLRLTDGFVWEPAPALQMRRPKNLLVNLASRDLRPTQ
ncbi:cytochrome P450 [Rhodococcus koreensis]|uniref:cytochrome P450 n=1 Tax=Rhodococcus koreensis TaxID=99653 RepID=UPI00366DABF4